MTARRAVSIIIAVLLGLSSTSLAIEPNKETPAEVVQFIMEHRIAFQNKDIDAVMAMYEPGQEALLMGTGPGERYVGQEEIRNAYLEYFKTFDTEESTITWKKVTVDKDVAWVAVQVYVTAYLKNVKNDFALNWTAVLVKKDGKWMFAQRHISNLTGMDEPL